MVSLIVPIYNAAPNLRCCLGSIMNQTHKDVEVILVDDGSTDESADICQEYCNSNPKFHLYKKENGGVASARNLGLGKASGEYIAFADADDEVPPTYIEELYHAIIQHQADLVIQGIDRVVGNHHQIRGKYPDSFFSLPGQHNELFKSVSVVTAGGVYAKLFMASIIHHHHLTFSSNICLAEDQGFVLDYLYHAQSVQLSSKVNYFYCENPKGLSTYYYSFQTEQESYNKLTLLWIRLMQKYPSNELKNEYAVFIGNFVNRMYYTNIIHPANQQHRSQNFREMQVKYLPQFKQVYKPTSAFTRFLKFCIIHHLPWLYHLAMKAAILRYNLSVNCR